MTKIVGEKPSTFDGMCRKKERRERTGVCNDKRAGGMRMRRLVRTILHSKGPRWSMDVGIRLHIPCGCRSSNYASFPGANHANDQNDRGTRSPLTIVASFTFHFSLFETFGI